MKVLQMHAKRFEIADDSYDNALVAFVAVEPGDDDSVDEAAKDLARAANALNADLVVVYPYSNLTTLAERPRHALRVLETLTKKINEFGVKAILGPFGRASFKLETFDHPLSHRFKSYYPKVKKFTVIKEYFVSPSGEFKESDECIDEELRAVVRLMRNEIEVKHNEEVMKFCKKFGITRNPSSPPGYHALLPHAYFMFLAFVVHASSLAQNLEIPINSLKTPEIVSYGCDFSCSEGFLRNDEFEEHRRIIEELAKPSDLPIAFFEHATLYRNEEEVVPCYRSKYFVVPRIRVFTEDSFEASSLVLTLHEFIHNEVEKMGLRYVAAYTVSKPFFEEIKDLIVKLVKRDNRCAYVRVVDHPEKFLDAEMHLINSVGSPIELGSWKLRKVKIWGREVYSASAAVMGSFERFLYVVFDKALKDMKEGKSPKLPAWLSPIQVRVVPLERDNLPYALSVAEELRARGVRVDVDDRSVPLSKKLRDAGKEWIPFVVVIGEREEKLGRVVVIRRKSNDREDMSLEELINKIREEVGSYPQLPQTLPVLYTKRPSFARPDDD